jgi:3-oxoacyl-[acyl-carrier protein] reductase
MIRCSHLGGGEVAMKKTNKSSDNKRTVLVTGGAIGIGRSVIMEYARHGWNIICHYCSSHDDAEKLQDEVEKMSCNCDLVHGDFTSESGILLFIEKIKKLNIDCLVNNAGSYVNQVHYSDLSFNDLVQTFSLNTFAPILITSSCFEQMKANNFGRIINISSIAAKYGGSSGSIHYGCAKRSLEGITRTFAREGASADILINTIRPGVIDTDFHKNVSKDMNKRLALIPLKKMGSPEDIARMVYNLGSEENKFITNEIITIAGGE